MESIEPAGIRNELRPLCLKHLPDRLLDQFRMMMRFGVSDAFVEQPSVHLVIGLECWGNDFRRLRADAGLALVRR
jgi:hypothetical protein